MLPNSEDMPARFPELRIGISVSALVGLDLLAPEVGVAGGPGRMVGAAMPVAAVDEDGHPRRGEDDIDAPASIG